MLQTKTNDALQFKLVDSRLFFKDDTCVMDDFEECEFLFAGDDEYNQAIVKEIEEAFSVKVTPQNSAVFDYRINFIC